MPVRSGLSQRRDVVEDVEAAAVRRNRDRVGLDPDVRDRHVGQVQRQRLPVIAVVVRDVEAVLRAGVEQAAARRILADGVHVVLRGDAGDDLRPRLAEVTRPEDVGREVAEQRLLDRDVGAAGLEARGVDMLTRPKSGMSFGVTFVQVLPPSRVTCTRPSSDPAQRMLTSFLPGPSANTVP